MHGSRRWLIFLFAAYLVGLHALVVVIVLKTDIMPRIASRFAIPFGQQSSIDSRSYRSANAVLDRIDQMMQKSPVVLLGDSIVQDLPPLSGTGHSLNLALGGLDIPGLTTMLKRYVYLNEAAGIVLGIGVNDLCNEGKSISDMRLRLGNMAAALPRGIPVVWSSILPVDTGAKDPKCAVRPETIRAVNAEIAILCAARTACTYSDGFPRLSDAGGTLMSQFHVGDGVHLNARGYAVWSEQLQRDLLKSGAKLR